MISDNQTISRVYGISRENQEFKTLIYAPSDAGKSVIQMRAKRFGLILQEEVARRLGVKESGQEKSTQTENQTNGEDARGPKGDS
jgi:ABC-type lipoprotein release transport system permease subunit